MLSIIIPTYNEKDNLPKLMENIFGILKEAAIEAEMVIVDDNSPDGTGELAEELAKKYPVKVLHREGKLGLSSAVLAGFSRASGEILMVTDADGSHDYRLIPQIVKAIDQDGYELVVASRYMPGGGVTEWPFKRKLISWGATTLGRLFTPIKDCVSGFFAFKREIISGVNINPIGYKVGLEIFAKGKYKKYLEIPYIFNDRQIGESKLSSKEIVYYAQQIFSLLKYRLFGR